jgi:Domain of unknown function (DUF4260)
MSTPANASDRPTRRHLPVVSRIGLGAMGIAAFAGAFASIGIFAPLLWLAPDVMMLAGLSRDMPHDGRMAPLAVPLCNARHALLGPLAMSAAGLAAGPAVLGLGLVWLSHVLIDRAVGYGLRTPEGLRRR